MININSIDVKSLNVLCAVYDENSFSMAAERLCLTQPGVSQHVKKLEYLLGSKVIKRGKKIELTEHGQLLYDFANDLRKMHEELNSKLNQGYLSVPISFISSDCLSPTIEEKLLEELKIGYEGSVIVHGNNNVQTTADVQLTPVFGDKKTLSLSEFHHKFQILGRDDSDVPIDTVMYSEPLPKEVVREEIHNRGYKIAETCRWIPMGSRLMQYTHMNGRSSLMVCPDWVQNSQFAVSTPLDIHVRFLMKVTHAHIGRDTAKTLQNVLIESLFTG
ncbi:TPA: LysR family transcriptional regulator [Vibrio vulnificus]|nr:LysR family transcriptional regulator [Vibrio vulnificus]HAS6292032.1 LysR family transcriptional regulator [Vibrio vulnificus]HAS6315143.1 LysR family transcriptional regulator [Vibrio vulnificus]HDY7554225.1 LysR family transcriptional regulator [Vibrio vulnificus]HDY7576522.1 LysR family transcriptional regulator [Vibrio vulnificus]